MMKTKPVFTAKKIKGEKMTGVFVQGDTAEGESKTVMITAFGGTNIGKEPAKQLAEKLNEAWQAFLDGK